MPATRVGGSGRPGGPSCVTAGRAGTAPGSPRALPTAAAEAATRRVVMRPARSNCPPRSTASASATARPPFRRAPLVRGPAGGAVLRLQGRAVGHLVQPTAHGLPPADARGLAHENEESGLEGVLGVRLRAQDAAADVEHHAAVPPRQQL